MQKVLLGTGCIYTDCSGIKKVYKVYEDCLQYKNCDIVLSLEEAYFFDANLSAILVPLIYKLMVSSGLKFFVRKEDLGYFDILSKNGMFGTEVSNTAIQLTQFEQNEDEKFYNYIKTKLLNNEGLGGVKGDSLLQHFCEVFTNVQLHAGNKKPLYACGQWFPRKHVLKFTLLDQGQGYLNKIKAYTKGVITTPVDAINWAVKEQNSTKLDAPGGMGLADLFSFCNDNDAELQIISDGCFWNKKGKKDVVTKKIQDIGGTTINIIFSCL